MELRGAQILVRTLVEQGVDVVFGYPGGTVLDIYDALYDERDRIRHVLVTHEQHAAHAADGYARASGKVGVCLATSGPGSTNLVTGIATAFLDSVPVVAITGNVGTAQIGTDSFQELDITGVTLPITKHNFFVNRVEDLAPAIREAFALAQSGRPGPVLLDVAKDVQQAVAPFEPAPVVRPDAPRAADDEAIAEAAAAIDRARCPFVYFGGGVVASGAAEQVEALARKIGAPMGCSLMGVSALPCASPGFLGMEGMHGHYASSMAMARADCIIGLGVRFNDRSTGDRATFAPGARIVHIDVDPSELSKNLPDDHALAGDLKLTLERLVELVSPAEHTAWEQEVAGYLAQERSQEDRRGGLTPANVMHTLQKHLTPRTPVVTDVGQHQMWAAQHLEFSCPRTFVTSGGLGTMGFSMGASVGAALATGGRVAMVVGDGGFGMCLGELATAVTEGLPVTVLVLENGVLGMVRQQQRFMCGGRYMGVDLNRRTDFVAVARAFGVQGERAGSVEELDAALTRGFSADGPYVVVCPVDKEELVLPMMVPGGSMDELIVRGDV